MVLLQQFTSDVMKKFIEKYPLITILLAIVLAVLLYTLRPQSEVKKSALEEVEGMPRYKMGEVFEGYSAQYKVTGLEFTEHSPSLFSDRLPEGSRYFVITVEVKNTGTEPVIIGCGKLEAVYEGKLLEYECDRALSAQKDVFSKINPQVRKSVEIYYVISKNVLGPFVWGPGAFTKVKFSLVDIGGAQWSDFSGVLKGARMVDLTEGHDSKMLVKIKRFFRNAEGATDEQMSATIYTYALIDIDGDGVNEVFALRRGLNYCGSGGCALDVLRDDNGEFKATAISWMAGGRIWILPTKTNGVSDVSLGGPRMKFNGTTYDVE